MMIREAINKVKDVKSKNSIDFLKKILVSMMVALIVCTVLAAGYACNDGVDNDGDGLVDLDDMGCASAQGNDENAAVTTCRTDFYSINGNIVANPNMECDNNKDGNPDNWTLSGSASMSIKWKSSALGKNSKMMVGYKNGSIRSDWSQKINISRMKPNTWYEVTFDLAAENTEPILTNDSRMDDSAFWNGLRFVAKNSTGGGYTIDQSYWLYGPAFTDWSESQGIYYQTTTRASEPWHRVVNYVKSPATFTLPQVYTLLYANTSFYVDNLVIREVSYDLEAPKVNSGQLQFIQYKGADFFPIIMEGVPYRTLANGSRVTISRDEIYSIGFNTLYHEYWSNYQANDPRFAEIVIFPSVYYNDYGLDEAWRNDPAHQYTYTGWNRFLGIFNTSYPNLLFVRLFDELTYPPSKGMHIGYLKPLEKAYNYIKQNSNAIVFVNWNGYYGNGPYTSSFDELVQYYFPYADANSFTQNLDRAYVKGDALPDTPNTGLATRKYIQRSILAGDYKYYIGYGLGVPEWSNWDGLSSCPTGEFKCNEYIPFNLQRFQIWDQIINGAVGITFWGLNNYCYLYFRYPEYGTLDPKYCDHQFNQAATITKEVSALKDVLLEPYYYDEFTVSDENIDVMMKKHNGKIYLLTASTSFNDLYDITFTLPGYTITSIKALNDVDNGNIANVYNRTVAVNSDGHSFTDDFIGENAQAIQGKAAPGYAVHIYELSTGNQTQCAAADLNCDTKIDVSDLIIVANDFGKTSGYNSKSDTNNDKIIDIFDVVFVASRFT
jgi:hypothetical protein